jgi:hypothetical protein
LNIHKKVTTGSHSGGVRIVPKRSMSICPTWCFAWF